MARTNPVEPLRKICLAFPEAEEKVFGGLTTPTYRVRDKIFVMESGDGARPAFWCKAPPGARVRRRMRCAHRDAQRAPSTCQ
jgi:hypothetical protein